MRVIRYVSLLALLLAASAIGAVPQPPPIAKSSDAPAKAKDAAPGPVTPPLLTGPKTAKYLATFTVTGLAATDTVFFDVVPDAAVESREGECDQSFTFGGAAGTYTVKARGLAGGKKFSLSDTVTLTGSPIPPVPQPPGPGPNPPGPGPTPDPSGNVASFVVVEDTLKAGPWRGEILGSPKVEAWYRSLQGNRSGAIHLLVDINAPANATAKKWADAAAGKNLPYLFMLDAAGGLLKECEAKTTSPEAFLAAFDLHADTPRMMGLLFPEDGKLKRGLFSAENPDGWNLFGSTPQTPIIPRAQFKNVSFASFLPDVYDQDGKGQCASSATCSTIETVAKARGTPFPKLSAGDLYGRAAVNGGRDRGSLLEDNLAEAMENGVAPASMVPYVWDGKMNRSSAIIAERKRYRVLEAYWCKDFDAMVSATQQGFIVVTGLMWPANGKVDADGWLSGAPGSGGHAQCIFGTAIKADGTIGVRSRNSWSKSFGIGGNCIIPENYFKGQIGGYFAVRVVSSGEPVTKLDNPFNRREFALAW